jgi:hypothetical protein
MRIPSRCRHVLVPQELADERKRLPCGEPDRGEAVPQIMDPQVGQAGLPAQDDPEPVEAPDRLIVVRRVGEDPFLVLARELRKQLKRCGAEPDDFLACLAVTQIHDAPVEVDFWPSEPSDLVLPRPGECQQSDNRDVAWGRARVLCSGERVAELGQLL